MSITTMPPDARLGPVLLDAVVSHDEGRLAALFSDDLWFRAMLVRQTIETHDVTAAIELFRGWFGEAHELQVLHTATYPIGGREHVTYRLRLRPDWQPDIWHVIEQTGYARVREGRISRLDLVCTGFVPQT